MESLKLMSRQFKRILEVAAALLVFANTIYLAASWERSHLLPILLVLLVIAVTAVLIVRYVPIYMRHEVRREFARQRVLDGVGVRADAGVSSPELDDDILSVQERRDLSS
jgi:NhaP-type Na+/H+ or K+/H+ antiporter